MSSDRVQPIRSEVALLMLDQNRRLRTPGQAVSDCDDKLEKHVFLTETAENQLQGAGVGGGSFNLTCWLSPRSRKRSCERRRKWNIAVVELRHKVRQETQLR